MHPPRSTIRWGIIGCGDVTEIKSGPAFQKATGSELIAVMRRRADLAADFARRHHVPRWYDNADALINDPEVDAVYIATPPGSHLEYALKVCRAGKPAYVEKPMARNYSECQKMVEAFAQSAVPLFVAYYRRMLPRFLKAKQIIDAGRLGTITSVSYRQSLPKQTSAGPELPWRLNPAISGGGLFLDLGSHTLDVLDLLVGPLRDVSGTASNVSGDYAVEDNVVMHFRTAAGATGVGLWNFASSLAEDVIDITGTDGRLSLATFGNDPVRFISSNDDEIFDLQNPPHVHQPLIQTIVDELLGRGKCPSTGQSAARTSQVMDVVLESYYGGRGDKFWEKTSLKC
jgi:1,5-anhydro-D-fructose reductase (1,5-anhydro-D-mannitol-forming)